MSDFPMPFGGCEKVVSFPVPREFHWVVSWLAACHDHNFAAQGDGGKIYVSEMGRDCALEASKAFRTVKSNSAEGVGMKVISEHRENVEALYKERAREIEEYQKRKKRSGPPVPF